MDSVISVCAIELLGGMKVRYPEGVRTHFGTHKCAALLAYLAMHSARVHSRELLTDLLWPEMAPKAARHNLRQTLYSLRKLLEPLDTDDGSILEIDWQTVRLRPEALPTDVQAFEQVALLALQPLPSTERHAVQHQITQLYRGELLPGWYEEWVELERTRLADLHAGVLHSLALAWENEGYLVEAVQCLECLLAHNIYDENAQEKLIQLYVQSGQTVKALQQYNAFRQILETEYDICPSPTLQTLIADLQADRAMPPVGVRGDSPTSFLPEGRNEAEIGFQADIARLPAPLTRFFGRTEEMERALRQLRDANCRLLTLMGPGGSGKTRLALEVAQHFTTSVHFIPLADITDASQILLAIADALCLRPHSSADLQAQILARLQYDNALLILDNFEQLMPEGTEIVQTLLASTSGVQCLLTSRQALGIAGELLLPVRPLEIPQLADSLEALLFCPSVAMLLDRIQARRPDFQMSAENRQTLVRLCQRLEGMPLAIEISAGHIDTLSPREMLTHLERALDFLVQDQRDVPTRHRSVRAAIAGSFALLTPELRSTLLLLNVFRGGWTLEAAQALAPSIAIERHLTALVAASLIQSDLREETIRFSMLESIREYTLEQNAQAEEVAARHATYYASLAVRPEPVPGVSQQAAWFQRQEADHANLLAALEWRMQHDPENGALLAADLHVFWWLGGHWQEGRIYLQRIMELSHLLSPLAQARVLYATAFLALKSNDYAQSIAWTEQSLDLFTACGEALGGAEAKCLLVENPYFVRDQEPRCRVLLEEAQQIALERSWPRVLGRVYWYIAGRVGRSEGLPATISWREKSIAEYRKADEPHLVAEGLGEIAYALIWQGKTVRAEQLIREALALHEELGGEASTALDLWLLAAIARSRGDYALAISLLKRSLAIRERVGEPYAIADSLAAMGLTALLSGDLEAAHMPIERALAIRLELGMKEDATWEYAYLGQLALYSNDIEGAREQFQNCLTLFERSGDKHGLALIWHGLARIQVKQREMASAWISIRKSLQFSRELNTQRQILECLETCAIRLIGAEDYVASTRILAYVARHRQVLNAPPPPLEQPAITEFLDAARTALGAQTFQQTWNEGEYETPAELHTASTPESL